MVLVTLLTLGIGAVWGLVEGVLILAGSSAFRSGAYRCAEGLLAGAAPAANPDSARMVRPAFDLTPVGCTWPRGP
jgi:hypothetical protein